MPAIFDFDCTLTIDHTFSNHAIERALPGQNQYTLGQKEQNIKRGLDSVLKHDELDLSAVATYHNNPEFVAGNISVILNKELTLLYTIRKIIVNADSSEQTEIAMNVYNVAGIDKPFLISYLPHEGDEFQSAMGILRNKNAQISAIREFWLTKGFINSTDDIDFYEDSSTNFNGARLLDYINGYLVTESDELEVASSYKALRPIPPSRQPEETNSLTLHVVDDQAIAQARAGQELEAAQEQSGIDEVRAATQARAIQELSESQASYAFQFKCLCALSAVGAIALLAGVAALYLAAPAAIGIGLTSLGAVATLTSGYGLFTLSPSGGHEPPLRSARDEQDREGSNLVGGTMLL